MGEVIAAVLGVTFLHVFFRAVESQWPASYFALTTGPDYAITRSLARYLAFRLLPVFVVAVFSAVTLARADRSVVIPVLVIGGLHALLTSGRALLGIVRSGRLGRRPLLGILHPAVMAAVIVTAVAGSLSANAFESIIPRLDEVTSALWTGLIAGVIGAYAVRVTQTGFVDTAVVFSKSRRTIPDDLWDLAAGLAGTAPRGRNIGTRGDADGEHPAAPLVPAPREAWSPCFPEAGKPRPPANTRGPR